MQAELHQALRFLFVRAPVLLSAARPKTPIPSDTWSIRYVSSVSASLASLACTTRDTQLHECAAEWVERLSCHLRQFPEGAPLTNEVVVNVFRVVNNLVRGGGGSWGEGSVCPLCINEMLMGLDARLTGMQFGSWKPQAVLYSLQAIAAAGCGGKLVMTNVLLYCAKEHLQRYDEERTARLLWCIIRLRQEETHSVLWSSACRRALRLYPKLKASGRALVLESLLLARSCTCEAQQRLLCVVHEDQRCGKEGTDQHDSGEENPSADLAAVQGEYHVLKGRLFSQVHQLPVETLVSMLFVGSGQKFPHPPPLGERAAGDEQTVHLILRHLACRPLRAAECSRVLGAVASLEPSELTKSVWLHVVDCIRSMCSKTPIVESPQHLLEAICFAAALERQQERSNSEGVLSLLRFLIVECHATRDAALKRCRGRLAGLLSVALDALTVCGRRTGPSDSAISQCSRNVAQFPEDWEKNGAFEAATVVECTAAVCIICELLRVSPLLRVIAELADFPAAITSEDRNMIDRGGSRIKQPKLVEPLLERCAKCLRCDHNSIPVAAVFDVWQHVSRVSTCAAARSAGCALGTGGKRDVLQGIVSYLFTYAESRPSDFSLQEVAKFVWAAYESLPVEAYNLFVLCLKRELANVSTHHVELLLRFLGEIGCRGDKAMLEQLLLSLFVRSLGHDAAFAHTAPFTTQQLVRLYSYCGGLSLMAVTSMRATLLQRMVTSCSEGASIEDLNAVASLLPQLQQGPQKDALAAAVVARGKGLNPTTIPDLQKALLLVYLHKAGLPVDDGLLRVFRKGF